MIWRYGAPPGGNHVTDIARERHFLVDQGLGIFSRETWGAVQDYTSARAVSEPVEGFFLHISVTLDHGDLTGDEHADMRTIERIGQERFGIGFPYNAAVFDTGRLYEGQPLTRRGAHTVNDEGQPGFRETGSNGSLNYWYRAICLPQMVTDDVTDAQVHQCARWAAAQIRAGYAKPLAEWWGHRDVSPKDCPGNVGYARLPEIRSLTRHYVANGLEDDMPLTGDEITAIANATAQRTRTVLRDTEPASLLQLYSVGLGNRNRLDALATAVASIDTVDEVALADALKAADVVDETAVALAVLEVLTPASIVAAIPDTIAAEVLDGLHERLAG
jgi:hypothetical protein